MKEVVFHIGFHKTGTTWLQNYYFTNDNNFCLLNNSINPWKDELMQKIITANESEFKVEEIKKIIDKRYKENFVNIVSAERLSGHPISGGHDVKKIAERVKLICPQAKIIMTKREPKSFVNSVYKQMVKEGYCDNVEIFLNPNNWKTLGTSKDYFLQKPIISIYKELFGDSNILELEFEEFLSNKNKYLTKIERFLNIPAITLDEKTLVGIVNKTFSNRRIRSIRCLNKVRKTELNPYPIFNLSSKTIFQLSKIVKILFSNKSIIKTKQLKEYLEE